MTKKSEIAKLREEIQEQRVQNFKIIFSVLGIFLIAMSFVTGFDNIFSVILFGAGVGCLSVLFSKPKKGNK